MSNIKLNTVNGSVTLVPEDGTGNVDITVPRAGILSPTGDGSQLTGISQFVEYNTTLQISLGSSGSTYTWSSSLPANVWVAADVFLASQDSDNIDHYNVHIGLATFTGNAYGETYPAAIPPYGVTSVTHLGDSQGVAVGYYGDWNQTIFKTDGSGNVYFTVIGNNAATGVYVRVYGYWTI
jgi:hypothetical protein